MPNTSTAGGVLSAMNRATPLSESLLVHAAFVRRVASALAGPQAGEDLSQDTWVAALESPPADGRAYGGWLATVARNLFRNQRRAAARRTAREQRAAVDVAVPAVDEIVAREELRRRVVDAVLALPAELREVVLLRYYEDLDSAAIGARLGRPAGTVRWQLHGAVQALRRELDRVHGGRRAWAVPLLWWQRARLGRIAPLFRLVWLGRALAATVLLLGVAWFTLPGWSGGPQPAAGPVPIAASPQQRTDDASPSVHERQSVPVGPLAAARIGPEELRGLVVRGTDGVPVADAEVQLQLCDADEFGSLDHALMRAVETLARARTDREGRFAFPVARARLHRLQVQAAGFATATAWGCTGGSEVTVRVLRGARLDGVVREGGSGQPVQDVVVTVLQSDPHREVAVTRTLADGTFAASGLPPGDVFVSAHHERFADGSTRLVLRDADAQRVTIDLLPGRTVTGRVTDAATGAPLAGAEVSDSHWFEGRVARTDVDGRYQLSGLEAETGALLFARTEGYCLHWGMQDEFGKDMTRNIAMVRAGSVRGRFVDGDGVPVANVFAGAGATFEISIGEATDWRRAAVGSDGRFAIDGLAPLHQYSLYVRGGGFGTRVVVLPRQVPAGEVLELGDVTLHPAGGLEGVVIGPGGMALVGAEVQLRGWDAHTWDLVGKHDESLEVHPFEAQTRRTRSDGRFAFGGLAHGNYRVSVQVAGQGWNAEFGRYLVRNGVVRDDLRLAVDLGYVITGTLQLGDGSPLPGDRRVILVALRDGGKQQSARVMADGSFCFARLEGAAYDIALSRAPEGWSMPMQSGIRADTKDLRLILQRAATIEGRVVDAQGRPCRAHVVCWLPFAGQPWETDAEGRFRIEVPPDFVGRITASNEDMQQAVLEDVAAGAKDLVLRLP